jgi:hyperosmotically inducible periplasmic protein
MIRPNAKVTVFLLAGAMLLSGCAAVVVGGAAAAAYYVGKDDRAADVIAKDATITAEVKSKLIAEPGVRSLEINVDTYDGIVTLKGDVKSQEQGAVVERIARSASGVKSVKTELRIK